MSLTREEILNLLDSIKVPSGDGIVQAGIVKTVEITDGNEIRITIPTSNLVSLGESHPDFISEMFSRLQEMVKVLNERGASTVEIYTPD